jgi:hypothetical protein
LFAVISSGYGSCEGDPSPATVYAPAALLRTVGSPGAETTAPETGTPDWLVTRPDTDQSEFVGAVGELNRSGRSELLPPHAEVATSQEIAAALRKQLMRATPRRWQL